MGTTKIRNQQIEEKTVTVGEVADGEFLTDDWDIRTGADLHRVKVDDPIADEDVVNKGFAEAIAIGTSESFTPTAGQTTFDLAGTPLYPSTSIVKVNGLPLVFGREYIITGNQVILQVGSGPDKLNYVMSSTDFVEVIWA